MLASSSHKRSVISRMTHVIWKMRCCRYRVQHLFFPVAVVGGDGQCWDVVLEWNWMATAFSSGALDDHCSFSGCLISNHSKQIVIALNRLEKSLREEKLFNVIHTDKCEWYWKVMVVNTPWLLLQTVDGESSRRPSSTNPNPDRLFTRALSSFFISFDN